MSKRSGGSLEMSKKFWKQALQEIDKFQTNLQSLEAEIKTLRIGVFVGINIGVKFDRDDKGGERVAGRGDQQDQQVIGVMILFVMDCLWLIFIKFFISGVIG